MVSKQKTDIDTGIQQKNDSDNHYKRLDGLRFLAILFVLIEHFAPFLGQKIRAGYYGVDLFFVISGYLITGILIKENDKSRFENLKLFLIRRSLRIFPLYYATIILLWVVNFDIIREYFLYYLLYIFNYAWPYFNLPTGPTIHFWSLSVEEQFYIFWPLLVLSLKKNTQLFTGIIILFIVIGYMQMGFNIFEGFEIYNYSGLVTRMSSLAFGALGITLFKNNKLPNCIFQSQWVELGVLLLLTICLIFPVPYWYLFLGLCSVFIVLKSSVYTFSLNCINTFLSHKKIVLIGTISYGIYLFHPIIGYVIDRYLFNDFWKSINFSFLPILEWHPWLIKFPLYSLVSILVAYISFRYFEKPIVRLKNLYFRY